MRVGGRGGGRWGGGVRDDVEVGVMCGVGMQVTKLADEFHSIASQSAPGAAKLSIKLAQDACFIFCTNFHSEISTPSRV